MDAQRKRSNEDPTDLAGSATAALRVLIRQHRERAGLSQTELAVKVGYSREYVSRSERINRILPSAELVQAIDNCLQAEGELSVAYRKAHAARLHQRRSLQVESTKVPVEAARHRSEPRAPVLESPSLAPADVIARAAEQARQFRSMELTSYELVETLHQDLRELTLTYPCQPLDRVLPQLARVQNHIIELLQKAQRPKQSVDLYFLGAVANGLLAKSAHDQGDPVSALSLARTAVVCSDHAGHPGLRAWICGLQALVSYWAGNPRHSIGYIEQGRPYAESARSTTLPWLASSEARAWARLGNSEKALECIERAEQCRSIVQLDDLDSMGGIAEFTEARQHYFAADALSWIPDSPDTGMRAQRAVDAYSDPSTPSWAFGDAAGSQIALALERLHNDGEDASAEILDPVLGMPTDLRINGVVLSVERVRDALNRRPGIGRVGSEMQDKIRAFAQSSIPEITR